MRQLLRQNQTQAAVLPVDWAKFSQSYPKGASRSFLSHLFQEVENLVDKESAQRLTKQANLAAVPPNSQTQIENSLCDQVAIVLKLPVASIDVQKPLIDFGLDSLMTVEFFNRIEKIFGKKLPLATIVEAPTIEKIADLMRDEEWSADWSSLVLMKNGGYRPPFFCVHGAGGNILIYHDLANHLDSDQPFYGLQVQGLNGQRPFYTCIEDMATHYIKEIKTVQPEGPYFLGGYCHGGSVALEIAQQLHAQGQKVALLALFETYNWSKTTSEFPTRNFFHHIQRTVFHVRNFLLSDNRLTFLMGKAKVAKGRKNIWYEMIVSKLTNRLNMDNKQEFILSRLLETNDRASINYIPKPYPGRITHFLPVKDYAIWEGKEFLWDELSLGGVELYRLPVYPAGMLVEPFVRYLAEKLQACIDRAVEKEFGK
jgi:aryl carrier-like protein